MKIKLFLKTIWGKKISCQCVIQTLSKFLGFSYRDINGNLYLLSVNILPMVETVLQKP